jgi:hypothetical protein
MMTSKPPIRKMNSTLTTWQTKENS